MNDIHPLRRAYDTAEREIAPRVETLIHSEEFTAATTWITKARRRIGGGIAAAGAGIWHSLNLPAGTDVKRLRGQIGSLDREVRQLRLQVERIGHEQSEGGDNRGTTADSERSGRPRAPRG
jgi:hypothetical protein